MIEAAHVGDGSVGQSESGVELDGLLEHLQRELQALAAGVTAAAQIVIVSLQVLGGLVRDRLFFLRREADAQGLGESVGDLVLNFEDVGHLAVVALSSQSGVIGAGLDQLRGDAQAVAGAADAAAQHVGGAQLGAHLRRGHRLVAVGKHGLCAERRAAPGCWPAR